MFLFLGIFWLMVSLTRFFEWYHFCHSMNGTNHTKITMHRCIWQALSYLNNYISFRNIYNTNILFNKKNEYLYNINCLPSCKNDYFHLLLYLFPMRLRRYNSRMLRWISLPDHKQCSHLSCIFIKSELLYNFQMNLMWK